MTEPVKHIVSFSGGMGSFAEAKSCVDKFGKENVLLLFSDTLMEDEDLYRFIKETYIISHDFIENDTNIFKNDDIYIEFTQNNEGLLNCCCNLITFDNKMFATPPNY